MTRALFELNVNVCAHGDVPERHSAVDAASTVVLSVLSAPLVLTRAPLGKTSPDEFLDRTLEGGETGTDDGGVSLNSSPNGRQKGTNCLVMALRGGVKGRDSSDRGSHNAGKSQRRFYTASISTHKKPTEKTRNSPALALRLIFSRKHTVHGRRMIIKSVLMLATAFANQNAVRLIQEPYVRVLSHA